MRNSFFLTDMWNEMAKDHKPILGFRNSGLSFEAWQSKALEKLLSLLGDFPDKVDLEAEVEFSEDNGVYIRKRVVFNVDRYMAVPCTVLIPSFAKPGEKLPAIVCSHGHGPFGKDPVTGTRGDAAHEAPSFGSLVPDFFGW